MKVKDITRQVKDPKIVFELKYTAKEGGGSLGFYNKNELYYNDKMHNMTIKGINIQYYNNTRYLVLEVQ